MEIEEEMGDWMSNYGSVEPSSPEEKGIGRQLSLADAKCAACGANFHCQNPSLPGLIFVARTLGPGEISCPRVSENLGEISSWSGL